MCNKNKKHHSFKNCLHTNNILKLNLPTQISDISNGKHALSTFGLKNIELQEALKKLLLDQNQANFNKLRVDFDNLDSFEHNFGNGNIDIDFGRIEPKNPLLISLKLFISKTVTPDDIEKYVNTFQEILIKTLTRSDYANDCSIATKKEEICQKYKIDMLILSLSKDGSGPNSNNQTYSSIDYILPYYKKLEELVEKKLVKNIGVSDVSDISMLEKLQEQTKIPPAAIQVKYVSSMRCDSQILDLIQFGEKHDVLMLRHSDEVPFLTREQLNSNVCKGCEKGCHICRIDNVDAVLKYSITSKWHSVLLGKGYFIFEN